MCQVNEEDDELFQSLKSAGNKATISRKCMSCDQDACVIVRIADPMCRKCFEEFFIHKFRSTISKSNIFERGERVLLAYSGGPSSTALLHLIVDGLSVNARRRLQFQAQVAFIDESSLYPDSNDVREKVIDLIKNQLNYPLHIVSIDENLDNESHFKDLLFQKTTSMTAREELIRRRRLKLLFDIAKRENCTKLITGDNCTKLAAQILSDMAQGKGAHVALECNFTDTRNDSVTIVRPFREIMSKEIAMYNRLNSFESLQNADIATMSGPQSSIFKLTETLVSDLQRQFPSTVSTIFRTSDKLEKTIKPDRCDLCCYPLDLEEDQSLLSDQDRIKLVHQLFDTFSNNTDSVHVCYACRRLLRDVKSSTQSH
ncbi:unnamed protein product [Rotaria magnacalcarata]|uniref:Cytoplasmic tRNA 2-thiolation protein 2 n=1 Tax=Rotaria magnacalcarata TaxID=392030 RepID=A0A816FL62_9BILA|nr:unnamed protein product [Rotaria magnacalcarata]CAF1662966.1 unnamed protein product [Rotaria magnacalcarata]CAF2038891.1 unnamed protein product [Rotaria magnacalcarata]CAF2059060.1 unnamed protein product [Rotaria magnacalcarata]CAF2190149.1 unnamed protein product [Rotaria magnacalcarata]